jgi:hypothetical protein
VLVSAMTWVLYDELDLHVIKMPCSVQCRLCEVIFIPARPQETKERKCLLFKDQ